ncbi:MULTISPECIES: GNAT family N-acetyltransferase [Caldimonas]|uniref:GNAT family N-acetyltransferase n=1 Tax=Caldimonas TaxID=196013 RepID=UPI00035E90B5|nr:GNAT family N-acetyltransferase [Caldimonas manganoxidans]
MWPSTLELQRLQPAHAHALQVLMLSLSRADRHARFGHALDDAALCAWVEALDWQTQRAWGLWAAPDVGLVAALHLFDMDQARSHELAVVVHPRLRRRGLARLLLQAALAQAPEVSRLWCAHAHPFIRAECAHHGWSLRHAGPQGGFEIGLRPDSTAQVPPLASPVKCRV